MLVLQMLFPSLGKAAGSGWWIEICSEFGAVEVQIPLEDQNSHDRECPDCDSCLICLAENGQTRSTQVASFTLVSATNVSPILRPCPGAATPAQFWASAQMALPGRLG